MKYFPLVHDRFEHQFGIRAIGDHETIIERTEKYEQEIAIKQHLLDQDHDNYVASLPSFESSLREAAELVASWIPENVEFHCEDPLLAVARTIQEDLVLIDTADGLEFPMIGGVVCFPSGWSIAEKMNLSIAEIHDPVPEFAEVMQKATENLLSRLKPGRPVWRTNWGVRASGQLDQSPKHAESLRVVTEKMTSDRAGDECYFRVERQTLSRLPRTGGILFTIHTHQCPLSELEPEQRSNLRGVLETCPNATLAYKGILPMLDAVLESLA